MSMNTDETQKNTEPKEPSKGGRPSKINKFVEATREVFKENEGGIFVYTDEDLLFLVNEKLEPDDQITDRTFQNYKAKLKEGKIEELSVEFLEFFRLIKRALMMEKKNILLALAEEKGQWTKWAWIMERKFKEWNLTHLSEGTEKIDAKMEFILSEFNPEPEPEIETQNENQLGNESETKASL